MGNGDGDLESDDVIASFWRLLADRGDDVGSGDSDLDDVLVSTASVTMIGLSIDRSRF